MLLLILTTIGFSNDKSQNDWEIYGFQGDVQSVTQVNYSLIWPNKLGSKKLMGGNQYVFDKKGRMIEQRWLNSDSSLSLKTTYKRNKKGLEIETKSYRYDKVLQSMIKKIYDRKGNEVERISFNSDGSLKEKRVYKYDNNDNWTELLIYDQDGNLEREATKIYNYDQFGNLIQELALSAKDSFDVKYTIYKYDEKQNLIEKDEYRQDSSIHGNYFYKYNQSGTLIEEYENYYYSNGKLQEKHSYTYDLKGNIIEWKWHYSSTDYGKNVYKFKFDKQGNWVEEIEFENGEAEIKSERKIIYYK